MISLVEYEVLQFTKRAYTDKYPAISLPPNISDRAVKGMASHLLNIIKLREKNNKPSEVDDSQDKFDGTNSNYDEKTSI
jgi:hypothetical protein